MPILICRYIICFIYIYAEADGDGTNVNGTVPVADADDFGEVAGPRLPLGTGSDSETLVGESLLKGAQGPVTKKRSFRNVPTSYTR